MNSTLAQPTDNGQPNPFDTAVDMALEQYQQGEYLAAAQYFQDAYLISPQPELVYNIARTYEKALLSERSIQEYERFLSLQGTTAKLRAKALDALAALKEERKSMLREAQRASTPQPTPTETGISVSKTPTSPIPRPSVNRLPEILFIGAGLGVVGTGAVLGVMALNSASDLQNARDNQAPLNEQKALSDNASSQALVSDVLVAVGAASTITGLVLLWARKGEEPEKLSLTPVPRPDGVGVRLLGRF
ncbi:MAG: hypothetical protein KTR25_05040 [Myxococcales bacterium]|nr:hypothetical protein [Myxococcales bacterium]